MNIIKNSNGPNPYTTRAANALKSNQKEEAYKIIIDALNAHPNSPEPQNLLGIWNEMNGNVDLARRHYRAAYALDPSYKPASRNLERLTHFFDKKREPIDFGDGAARAF